MKQQQEIDPGSCPTGRHTHDFRHCGFAGCVDLRSWAAANRYRYRLEESYKAETDMHIRGDGRWYVEILCRNGLIYPYGGSTVLAYTRRGVARKIAAIPGAQHHQWDGFARVFRIPAEALDQVAAILKPRRRAKPRIYTLEQLEILRGRLRLARQKAGQTARKASSDGLP